MMRRLFSHRDIHKQRAMSITRNLNGIIGESPWATQIRNYIKRIAKNDANVVITGPTGSGKRAIARAVHAASRRAEMPFVPVDCRTLVGKFFRSQLFGHRQGAFAGSSHHAMGCFRAADGGVIFLDQVGEMELEIQAQLLEVIQERQVKPVGSDEQIPVDVRIIGATNRDLPKEVRAGRFREDLFYWLNAIHLTAEPLKNRPDDVGPLARHFAAELASRYGVPELSLSRCAIEYLAGLEFPGNLGQLRDLIEQALIYCEGPLITAGLLRRLVGQLDDDKQAS